MANPNDQTPRPPRWADRLLEWFVVPHLLEDLQGDLQEVFHKRTRQVGLARARREYAWAVLHYLNPSFRKSYRRSGKPQPNYPKPLFTDMLRNYLTIARRNLARNKASSAINIGGLAGGLAVAMLIGLWIHDEVSYNTYHRNYGQIAQVWSGGHEPATGTIDGSVFIQHPVGPTLRNHYPQYFKHVLLAWGVEAHTLSTADKRLQKKGLFIEGGALDMLSLRMLKGSYQSLDDPQSVVLSQSAATALFGESDPVNQRLRLAGRMDVKVSGVYEDIPANNRFSEVQFFAPWALWAAANDWVRKSETDWDNRPFTAYVQLQPNTSVDEANAAIRDLYARFVPADFYQTMARDKPFVQLIPMRTWHLYGDIINGKPAGGRITYVWLFGIVGLFVLLLACINFINLSKARSEKRAREVGVRKVMGSARRHLIGQFLSESCLVVLLAFLLALGLVAIGLDGFNALADKEIRLPFGNPQFWLIALAFILGTGLLAGLYPAFYLSAFQPVKALRGVIRFGRLAALPRQILVVTQFTVSIVLIMGTLIVYRQIQYAQNRPIGYDRSGLLTVDTDDPAFDGKHEALKRELLSSGVVSQVSTSSNPLTAVWNSTGGYDWPGKAPNRDTEFAVCKISPDYGPTVGWKVVAGRDFSPDIRTDSTDAVIINEAAARYMGLENPVGQKLTDVDEFGQPKWSKTIIGVVKDLVMDSPYDPVKQTIFYQKAGATNLLHIRIDPTVSAQAALPRIEATFRKVAPAALFDYQFVDQEYALKFSQEKRIGTLAGIFAGLAIFISCLGLFGLAAFVAEQRTKEIGIRKVLGASVGNLWGLLSSSFVNLVLVACGLAVPISYYFLGNGWIALPTGPTSRGGGWPPPGRGLY